MGGTAGLLGLCFGLNFKKMKRTFRHLLLEGPLEDGHTKQECSQGQQYHWERISSDNRFPPSDGMGLLSFQGSLFILGGWNPSHKPTTNNQVWSSSNGSNWTLKTTAPWEPRHTAGVAVFKDKMWVVGGDANLGHYQPDIWSSPDGVTWERVVAVAPWAKGGRVLQQLCVHNGKMYLIGGQTLSSIAPTRKATVYDDVWVTEDGANWVQVANHCPWGARSAIGGHVSLGGYMYLIGGGAYSQTEYPSRVYKNDVWRSKDGAVWEQVAIITPFSPRLYHSTAAFDGKMWVIGGSKRGSGTSIDIADTWFSNDGITWEQICIPWKPRHCCATVVHQGKLFMLGGPLDNTTVWALSKSS